MAASSKRHTRNKSSARPTVGCLFSAIGGFCKAFSQAGGKVVWANERDKHACETFRHNFPDVRCIEKPIETVSVQADNLEPVTILTAGFPCQPFSIAGEQLGFSDYRGLLFMDIARLLREWGDDRPAFVLLENVRYLLTHNNGRTFSIIQNELQRAGYWFTRANAAVLNTASLTAIPQHRERLFMVAASTARFSANPFQFPTARQEPARDLWSFFDTKRKASADLYFKPGDRYYRHFDQAISEGGRQAVYLLRRNYVRQNKTGRCFTLMANMGEGGHNQPVIADRWGYRKLSPVECARLQGYDDDWFDFPPTVSRRQRYKQVGNSVTVPLVKLLASQIVDHVVRSKAPRALKRKAM
jgi:DNA (cytosine-5)-methyltransferase 1